MKNLISITAIILLISSCGKDAAPAPEASCSPTKTANSVWTRKSDGATFDARNCAIGTVCYFYNDSACDAVYDTEFSFLYASDGSFAVGDCNLNTQDTGTYSISCNNTLTLTYSDGTVVTYE